MAIPNHAKTPVIACAVGVSKNIGWSVPFDGIAVAIMKNAAVLGLQNAGEMRPRSRLWDVSLTQIRTSTPMCQN